ncbi:MAG TPA: phosphatidylglycerophosphatase A [Stellaceae bacterium]|nr:phosphatidylglycerophosphatase A [Stellaceae bacterium]
MEAAAAPPLRRSHPAMLAATLCGVGFMPRAPGTWGTLVALPFAWLVARAWGAGGLVAGAFVLFVLGWWAAAAVTRVCGKDPQFIVIDEAAGQFLALAAAPPLDPWFYVAAFGLFRIFDIAKPFPVGWADRRIGGGFGVMFDDALAAVYAALVLMIARLLLGR